MEKIVKKIFLLLSFIFFLFVFIGEFFYKKAIDTSSDKSDIINQEGEEAHLEDEDLWFEENANEVKNKSIIGIEITGYEFLKDYKKPWIIVIHGYGTNAKSMSFYIKNFYNRGYNVLAPDLIGHGRSKAKFISMGGYDSKDMRRWIDFINENYSNPDIALFGISMGASTVINTLGQNLPENVRAFIEDSGYLNLDKQFAHQLKKLYKLPSFPIITISSAATKIRAGFSFKEVDATKALEETKIPGLILHGAQDSFVPTENANEIYKLLTSPKEIYISENLKHVQAGKQDYDNYWNKVQNFLNKYLD